MRGFTGSDRVFLCRGVHLKDLISLHTALPDYVEGGLINVSLFSISFGNVDNQPTCTYLLHPI